MKFYMLFRNVGYGPMICIFVTILIIGMNFCVNSACATTASDLAKCVGYSMGGQSKVAGSLSGVDCSSVRKKLAGMVDKEFFLSGILMDRYKNNDGKGIVQGTFIHQDKFERELFSRFTLHFAGMEPAEVTDVSIQAVSNLIPRITTYLIPSEKISLKDLQKLEFTRALELVSLHARKFDGNAGPDAQLKDYLVVAFQMDKETDGRRLTFVMDSKAGTINGKQTGKMISRDGWIFIAAPARITCDSGKEIFFNVIREQRDKRHKQIAGVFSNYSLERRVQQSLTERGYSPDAVDEKPGRKTRRAIKAFQKKVGLYTDGKVDSSLLRLLRSPDLSLAPLLVQQHLSYLGYDVGSIDGRLRSKTREAVRAFQRDNDMIANGRVDAALFCRVSDTAIQTSMFRERFENSTVKPVAVAVKRTQRFEDRMWPNQAAQ